MARSSGGCDNRVLSCLEEYIKPESNKNKPHSTAAGLVSHLDWRSVLRGYARLYVSGAFLVCICTMQ